MNSINKVFEKYGFKKPVHKAWDRCSCNDCKIYQLQSEIQEIVDKRDKEIEEWKNHYQATDSMLTTMKKSHFDLECKFNSLEAVFRTIGKVQKEDIYKLIEIGDILKENEILQKQDQELKKKIRNRVEELEEDKKIHIKLCTTGLLEGMEHEEYDCMYCYRNEGQKKELNSFVEEEDKDG